MKKSLLAVELFLKSMILLMSECTLQKKIFEEVDLIEKLTKDKTLKYLDFH